MYITQSSTVNRRRRVNLPHERVRITSDGLGDLEGFNIGKMFKRMVTVNKNSFKMRNIMGTIGSVVGTIATGGLGPALAPKTFSAHSSAMVVTGSMIGGGGILPSIAPKAFGLTSKEAGIVRGITGAAAAIAGGVMFAPAIGGAVTGSGGMFSTIMGGAGKLLGGMFGGKGGGGQQPQEQIDSQPVVMYPQQQYVMPPQGPQAPYGIAAPVSSQLSPMTFPTMGGGGGEGYSGYSPDTDLRMDSPYSALTDTESTIDPITGLPKPKYQEASMIPEMSTQSWLVLGGVTLVGWYLLSDDKKGVGNA